MIILRFLQKLQLMIWVFLIGPKINAGGRLGFSSYGSELLSADDESAAEILSIKLNELNENRKKIEEIHLNEITLEAEKYKNDPVFSSL